MEEESSMNSCISKNVASSERITHNSCEESGWTAYFEDLSDTNEHNNFSSRSFGSSSMVSDASSYPSVLKSCKEHSVNNVPYSSVPKKLNLMKKSRAKEISHVDLEDTASSPVNSPKVSDLRPTDYMNPRKADDHNVGRQALQRNFQVYKYNEKQCVKRIFNNGYTNLKKGKCLFQCPF